jgi:hypothetical protein
MLFDKDTPAQNMKDAERSTYTFISEMEEGGSISAQDLVKVCHATHMRCSDMPVDSECAKRSVADCAMLTACIAVSSVCLSV